MMRTIGLGGMLAVAVVLIVEPPVVSPSTGLRASLVEPAWAAKDRDEPITQRIERERRALEKLNREIEEKRKHAEEAEKKRESLLQALQDLDERLLRSRQERQAIDQQLKRKDQEIEEITARIAAMRARMAERKGSILARLRVQYMEGRLGHLKSLLAAQSLADLQRRFQYLSAVSQLEFDLMKGYRIDLIELEEAERQRARAREEMLGFKQRVERSLAEIQEAKQQKRVFLAKLTREKASYDLAVEELEKSAARVDQLLRKLLKDLEDRRRAAAARPPAEPKGLHPARGALPWPAEGEVVSFFGRQKHPQFDTYVERKGIEIRTDEGSAIRAVMSGHVAFADWLKGYGLVLILDHGNGFFSLYAHASKLQAKVGDLVQAGQVIGETGDTGLTGDSTLYFELRQGAEPVDPLAWLAKRR
ncbi:murein hydrolase activator EnvC family protein [Nitrospira sp. Kam-Ns4a]